MANESNRYPRRPDRDRNRSYTRQQEQFEDSSWREDDRWQMGEVRDREDDGQFDLGGQSREHHEEQDNGQGQQQHDP